MVMEQGSSKDSPLYVSVVRNVSSGTTCAEIFAWILLISAFTAMFAIGFYVGCHYRGDRWNVSVAPESIPNQKTDYKTDSTAVY